MKLEVGKYYRNRTGEVVFIQHFFEHHPFPYFDGEDRYLPTGRFFNHKEPPRDLISEVIPTPAVRVLEVQTNTRDFVSAMEESKGKVYTKFGKIVGGGKVGGVRLNLGDGPYPYSYFPDQVEEGIICPVTGEFIAMKNETKIETKQQETKEMKYYRVTRDSWFNKGDIVVLHYDDGTENPKYKDVNTGKTGFYPTRGLEEINVKTTTLVKGPASRMIKQLEDEGWVLEMNDDEPNWREPGGRTLRGAMLQYCGKPKPEKWSWNDEWLETKYEFESLVKPKPSLNHRQFLIDFMKKKQELSHPSYLYTGDVNEMKNDWSDEDCERVANDIINKDEWGFNSTTCPFCIYKDNVDIDEEKCEECSYGKRHGICGNDGSDYQSEVIPNRKYGCFTELKTFVTNYPGVNKK